MELRVIPNVCSEYSE